MDIVSGELVPTSDHLPAEVEQLREEDAQRVLKYMSRDMAPNTRRAYENHLKNFNRWCQRRQVSPVPATEETVIAYLTWACNRPKPNDMRPSSARAVKSAISVIHDNGGFPNPTRGEAVKNALRLLDREFQGGKVRQVDPLLIEDVEKSTAGEGAPDPTSLRDAAIIWVAYGGLLRRSEVVALDVEDLEGYWHRLADGTRERRTRVAVRRSKTDQTGKGAFVDIPTPAVVAIRAWLDAAGITTGAIFRPFNHSKVLDKRLTPQMVAIVMKKRTAAAGVEGTFSGHSGRRGGATEAKARGIDDSELKRLGRWVSADAMGRYIGRGADTNPDVRAGVQSAET